MERFAADLPATVAEYCRRARRIRASFRADPFLRYQGLHDLAKKRNAHTERAERSTDLPSATRNLLEPTWKTAAIRLKTARRRIAPTALFDADAAERDFIGHIARKLHPFGFTFSDRALLLDTAEQLGISRFRANMILALHEHQTRTNIPAAIAPGTAPAKPQRVVSSLMAVLAMEALVVSILVWACLR